MGLQLESLLFIHDCLERAGVKSGRMCELGNQQVRLSAKSLTDALTGKGHFQFLGFEHVSIDLNAVDGALPLDLCQEITDQTLVGTFDVLTNAGTSEHVRDQYWCFRNVHALVRQGGLMIHLNPEVGSWHRHGRYHYTQAFHRELASAANYRLLHARTVATASNGPQKDLVCVALVRGRGAFPSLKQFQAIFRATTR